MRTTRMLSLLAGVVGAALPLADRAAIGQPAQQTLIKAKRIYTAGQPAVIDDGEILIENGKIAAVGTRLRASAQAKVIIADTAIPGLIDTHAHVANDSLGEPPAAQLPANTAEISTIDRFRFGDPVLETIAEGGVTTLVTRGGGPGQVFKGQCLAIKLKNAPRSQVVLKEFADMLSNVRVGVGGSVMTLSGYRATARREFIRAREYLERREAAANGGPATPRDPRLEPLVALLKREVPLHVHVNFKSEILMVIDLAREFNLRLTLAHANYGHQVAAEIKAAGAIPVIGPTFIVQSYDEQAPQNVPA